MLKQSAASVTPIKPEMIRSLIGNILIVSYFKIKIANVLPFIKINLNKLILKFIKRRYKKYNQILITVPSQLLFKDF